MYSNLPKLPGTQGSTFMAISAPAINAPIMPVMRERGVTTPPAPKQKARQVASHPVADASEPTSEIGINTACPSNAASAVINPTNKTGTVGVRYSP